MNITAIIEAHETLRVRAEQLINTNDPSIEWTEGHFLRAQISGDDIRLDVNGDSVRCSGHAWTHMFGGSVEFFDCTIPVSEFANVLEA